VVPEREHERHRRAHEVEGPEVDAGGVLGPGAAPQHAAAGRLRAVAELAGAQDREHRRGERDDGGVGREHGGPRAAHEARERGRRAAEREPEHEADRGRAARAVGPVRAQLVADARGHAEAERGREDVDERRGLDQDAHGRHGRLRVGQQAAQQDHDLVPPPLQAHADAVRQGQADELAPVAEAVGREREGAGALVRALEQDVGKEEDDEVQVGQDRGECHPSDAEAEDGDEHVVDWQVERDGEPGAQGERQIDGLRPEVDADRMEARLEEQVREGHKNVGLRDLGDAVVLATEQEQRPNVHPEPTDGDGSRNEQEHGALHGDAELLVLPRAVGLPADRLHAHGEPRQHGVPCDVCEADGEGPAGER
jgi:hypothetical protein